MATDVVWIDVVSGEVSISHETKFLFSELRYLSGSLNQM